MVIEKQTEIKDKNITLESKGWSTYSTQQQNYKQQKKKKQQQQQQLHKK